MNIYINEDLTTGLNDGTSEINAYRDNGVNTAWEVMVLAEAKSLTEDTYIYVESIGAVSEYRYIQTSDGWDKNGFNLYIVGLNNCKLYSLLVVNAVLRCEVSAEIQNIDFVGGDYGLSIYSTDGGTPRIKGCNAIGAVNSGFYMNGSYNMNGYAYNCNAVDCGQYGFSQNSNRHLHVINCYAGGNGTEGFNVISGTITTCASDDGSEGITVPYSTATFVNVTADSEDLRTVTASLLRGSGTGPSTDSEVPAEDPDGNIRSGTTSDIGVFEYVETGLKPIGLCNVTPRQNIGSSFAFGVEAYSKGAISNVSFAISGLSYSAENKVATEMSLNPRTFCYEYFVTLIPSDFTGSGSFTVTPTITGADGGLRTLDAITMYSGMTEYTAYVEKNGDDTTGDIDNESLPFLTMEAAIEAINLVNTTTDGAIIYLGAGEWGIERVDDTSADNRWLTISGNESLNRAEVIISSKVDYNSVTQLATYFRFKHLTISGFTAATYPFFNTPLNVWYDDVKILGNDRHVSGDNPISRNNDTTPDAYPLYFTDGYIGTVDLAFQFAKLVRNTEVESIGNDAFQNCEYVTHCTVDDIDPGESTYWHSDVYQAFTLTPGDVIDNRIVSHIKATNLHYQGIYISVDASTDTDIVNANMAIVNCAIEMREPGRPSSDGGADVLTAGGFIGAWDHLVMWNNTFIGGAVEVYSDSSGRFSRENCSIQGNLFEIYIDYIGTAGEQSDYTLPDNTEENDFLFNHYHYSSITGEVDPENPVNSFAKSPDSSSEGTKGLGDPLINLNNASAAFMHPEEGSPLLGEMTSILLVDDVIGDLRDGVTTTIGAFENTVQTTTVAIIKIYRQFIGGF